jgi:hypothetical protein
VLARAKSGTEVERRGGPTSEWRRQLGRLVIGGVWRRGCRQIAPRADIVWPAGSVVGMPCGSVADAIAG